MKPKLSRKQIKEGLSQVPMDTILLGTNSPVSKLTPKQREFARLVAMGETKAGAYREAYKSKGNPHTVGNRGYELAGRGEIQGVIDAYQAAIEAAKYRTPSQLRELVIHQLTQHALDDSCPPAQRIKALELLGKVSEVAAFTERKETTVINQSADIRAKLLEHLRTVVDAEDITPNDDADSLLQELSPKSGNVSSDPHPDGTPQSISEGTRDVMHNNPHEQIQSESAHEQFQPESDPHPLDIEDTPLVDENER